MQVSLSGIASILSYEEIILTAYDDGYGILTIGAGHTGKAGTPKPKKGMKIDLVEAFNIFRQDLEKFARQVRSEIDVALSQNQFDALVSWHFNTGKIWDSTLTKRLNTGDYNSVSEEMARWKFAQGKLSNGLVNRRKHEIAIFASGDYGERPVVVRQSKGAKVKTLSPAEIAVLMGDVPDTDEEKTIEQLLANPKSKLLPQYRPRQSEALSRQTMELYEHLIPIEDRNESVSVLGVRGYYENSLGKKGANDRGLYDDAIFIIEPDGVHNFNANTDPSRFRKGIAQLKARQALRYIPGPHGYNRKNGPYPAFRQDSECTVNRDGTGEDTGIFWINLHRGGLTGTSSAGCQTIPPHQWNEFRTLLNTLLERYGQETFQYVLLDEADVPDEVPGAISVTAPKTIPVSSKIQPDMPTGDIAMPTKDTTEVMNVLQEALELAARIRSLRTGADIDRAALGKGAIGDGKVDLNDAFAVLAALSGDGKTDPADLLRGAKKLTPINGVLGQTVGKLLNGKKTGIGLIGLVATSLVSIFAPELNLVGNAAQTAVEVAPTVFSKASDAATTLFGGTFAWGVLGKVEKWYHHLKAAR
ncbi:lysozyme [Pararhizobium sp. IMCC21322]|uniref:lysozyme n=1 Tax=Pararhizobium sp. IMCC21322 TaxID=3067903 RepID=UPI002740EF75|nr:lysozyme [Pararhizobium sp. IMCC21322]